MMLLSSCAFISTNNNVDFKSDNFIKTFSDEEALPNIPTQPIFVTFNNAYKMLSTENESIGRKDPKNSDKYFFSLIRSSKKTLDVAFFDIDDPGAIKAFIDAKRRGVNVRVVTDTDNTKDKENPSISRSAIEDLKSAGIPVIEDHKSSFMHHKFMIVDNKSVWLGSTNPTVNSMYHHNNNAVLIQSEKIAENYNVEFKRMFESEQFGPINFNMPNPVVNIEGQEIRTYFSPRGGSKQAIIEELKKAQKSIKFMAFSYTDKDMANIMIEKKKLGLSVEGAFDECLLGQSSVYYMLKAGKVFSMKDGNQALLHHKTIIIDNETVINGSFNFSKSAEERNNEDFVIIKSKSHASYFLKEYERVKNASLTHTNIPPYDHPACNRDDNSPESLDDIQE